MAYQCKDLEIWRLGRIFFSHVNKVTAKLPDAQKFGLANPLRKVWVSVTSKIAEGSSRKSSKDFISYLEIATGSLY